MEPEESLGPTAAADRTAGQEDSVSVVIPYYKSEDTIMRAVERALHQDKGRSKVIVVIDDGSREMQRLLEQVANPRLTVLFNEENLGAPKSRNRGLSVVETPYVSFLDADDYFIGDLVGSLATKMKQEGAQIGFGPSIRRYPDRGLMYPRFADYRDHEDAFLRWFSGKQNVNTSSVVWSTHYLREIGGWDESLKRNQDGELALRAILLGARFAKSTEGWGVWSRDPAQDGITGRSDNLASLLQVVDKFLAMRSPAVSDEVRVRACAMSLYNTAHVAFNRQRDDIALTALERSRSLGFKGHLGTPVHVIASTLLGLPMKQRMTRSIRSRVKALQVFR